MTKENNSQDESDNLNIYKELLKKEFKDQEKTLNKKNYYKITSIILIIAFVTCLTLGGFYFKQNQELTMVNIANINNLETKITKLEDEKKANNDKLSNLEKDKQVSDSDNQKDIADLKNQLSTTQSQKNDLQSNYDLIKNTQSKVTSTSDVGSSSNPVFSKNLNFKEYYWVGIEENGESDNAICFKFNDNSTVNYGNDNEMCTKPTSPGFYGRIGTYSVLSDNKIEIQTDNGLQTTYSGTFGGTRMNLIAVSSNGKTWPTTVVVLSKV